MTTLEHVVLEVKGPALVLALASVGTENNRPKLQAVYLAPGGEVVGCNGHRLSCYRKGWAVEGDGAATAPAEGWQIRVEGKALTALRSVAKAAARKGRNVCFFPLAGDTWRALAMTGKNQEAVVKVLADGPKAEWPYPQSWRQVMPWGERVEKYAGPVPKFDATQLGAFGDALVACGYARPILGIYPTGMETAAALRSADPLWMGVLMPCKGDGIQGWTPTESLAFTDPALAARMEQGAAA